MSNGYIMLVETTNYIRWVYTAIWTSTANSALFYTKTQITRMSIRCLKGTLK